MPTLKPGTIWPTAEEAVEIEQHAMEDGTVMSDEQLSSMRPMGRPKLDNPKKQVTLRLDDAVVEYFRASGKGWQTRLNAALKAYIRSH